TLRECRHRSLARRLIAVRRRAVFMVPEGKRPHPRRVYGRRISLEDAADDSALRKHVKIVVVPLALGAACRRAFEDEVVLVHPSILFRSEQISNAINEMPRHPCAWKMVISTYAA